MTSAAKTILEILNAKPTAPRLSDSALVIVDAQREYVDGGLPLYGIEEALKELKALLERARKQKIPIFHVVHHAPDGAPVFNPQSKFAEIAESVRPTDNEPVIVKHLPSSFVNTDLKARLDQTQTKNLILGGFMTHMCIDATARSAMDLGFAPTVVASTCTTRDLPGPSGNIIPAKTVHDSALAALSDLIAGVVLSPVDLPD